MKDKLVSLEEVLKLIQKRAEFCKHAANLSKRDRNRATYEYYRNQDWLLTDIMKKIKTFYNYED